MSEPRVMRQVAPYPDVLAGLVARLRYRGHMGWKVKLEDDLQRDRPGVHAGEARGMTLVAERHGPDSYHPADIERALRDLLTAISKNIDQVPGPVSTAAEQAREALRQLITVSHYFPVPAATYDERSWRRWLFDRLGDIDTHERMEDFVLEVTVTDEHGCQARSLERPYAPSHGPGNDPYMVRELGTDLDQRTRFTGEVAAPRHECEHQASNFTPCRICGA